MLGHRVYFDSKLLTCEQPSSGTLAEIPYNDGKSRTYTFRCSMLWRTAGAR